MSQQTYPELDFLAQLNTKIQPKRIPSMPLDFDCLSADIITKQLTKLNNPHPYRIHYLGPRPHHSAQLHKRYGRHWNQQQQESFQGYQLSLRSIGNHCFSNKQQLNCQTQFFYRAFEGMNPTLKGLNCYIFNAAFEGGNLDSAVKVGAAQFDLFLRVDSNTRGHTGWFYFSIKNGNLKQKIKLNLCNLKKHAKLYEQGMTPFVFSTKAHSLQNTEWTQNCTNVTFDCQPLRFDFIYQKIESYSYSKLSFQYEFQYENDQVFFAYCVPYTYSRLQRDIRQYRKSQHVKQYSLGLSLTGLQLPLLHMTDRNTNSQGKKYIIITGRVHPGQSNSSHQVHGLITWLIGNSKQAEALLKEIHFFIIPMINPDGVVLGNTRTSVSGKDLNRQFTTNNSQIFPEVLLVKNLVSRLQRSGKVMLYIDFHGHSLRKNTFLYGPNYTLAHAQFLRCRLLPKLIQKVETSFRYYSCSFSIAEYKKTTARAVMLSQMKIPYVYTIESSNGLFYDPIQLKTVQFTEALWQKMGRSIGKAIAEFNEMMLELQNMAQERKQSRVSKRKDKLSLLLDRKPSRQHNEYPEQSEKTKDYPQIYMELINQMKLGMENEKKVDDQVDSDDYDETEDISNKKLSSFTNALANYKKQAKSFFNEHMQSKNFISFPNSNLNTVDQNKSTQMFDFNFNDFQESASHHDLTKNNAKKAMMQDKRLKASLKSVQQSKKRKMITDRITQRRSLQSCSSKKSIQVTRSLKKQAAPITLYPQKPRYSLLNRNSMFPLQANLQTIKIPKDLKILRREMKKGRLLITNLQQSRLKFISLQERQFQSSDKMRGKQSTSKIAKTIQRPSTGCITSATVNLNQQVRLRPTQPYLHGMDNFISMNGDNSDFNGLMIRPAKRRR